MSSESTNMELTAEEKRIRKDRVTAGEQGSSVLLVRSQLTLDDTVMVKVNTSGLTEKEVRGLMEIINSEDFLKNVNQSRATCKIRISLSFIDTHRFRGETVAVTLTFSKSTGMMAINEDQTFIDHIEDEIKVVLQEWQPVPLTKGHEHWGEAFHQIIKDGVRSLFLEQDTMNLKEEGQHSDHM